MEYKDYYQMLGIGHHASPDEIKRAYRKLARQCHPDLHPGDWQAAERFREISEAYQVLSDFERRTKYDRFRASYLDWQQRGARGGFDWGAWRASAEPCQHSRPSGGRAREGWDEALSDGLMQFSEFFKTLFGGLAAHPPGTDHERAEGAPRARDQSETPPSSHPGNPESSSRLGLVPRRGKDRTLPVEVTLEEAYLGATRVFEIEGHRLEVKIPAGVSTGSVVRVTGGGWPGIFGGPAGDLCLNVNVMPHQIFERFGNDLRCEVEADLYTMLLGGEVPVPALMSTLRLRLPPETQNGCTFRLKGKGMPIPGSSEQYGDLYVKVRVVLPQGLSEHQRSLVRQLAALDDKSNTPGETLQASHNLV